jgi:hypothetical protein
LRASEVGLLQVDDLNFAPQRLTIHRVKRSLPGSYPLRADEVMALKAYLCHGFQDTAGERRHR